MSTKSLYTAEMLRQMKGQAVKDIWHAMIGKPAGIKNTTGLRNTEEIIEAILKGQQDPDFRAPKPKPEPSVETMPPKKKDILQAKPTLKRSEIVAVETTDIPLQVLEVHRRHVRKLHVDDASYFLDIETNDLYSILDTKPGNLVGKWNPEERLVLTLSVA